MGRNLVVPVLGLVLLAASASSAATVLRFNLKDLCQRGKVILHGKVVSKQARKAEFGAIVTDLRLEVIEPLKGFRGKSFAFSVYGGVLGERGSAVSGAPTFNVGEEVLVFLDQPNRYGLRTAIGLSQGKYSIRAVDGKKLAFRDMEGLRLLDEETGKVEDARPEQGQPFDALLKQVKAHVAAQATREEEEK